MNNTNTKPMKTLKIGSTTYEIVDENSREELVKKVNKEHAEITGSLSMGRKSGTKTGTNSTALGVDVTASGNYSHAEGLGSIASGEYQHIQGKYNVEDTENKYAHIVGNGNGEAARSNAHTLDWDGNGWYSGKLSQEGTPKDDKDLTTKKYVDNEKSSKSLYGDTKINLGRKANTNGGYHSVALGSETEASNDNAYAEGYGTKASGSPSHAEGMNTVASGRCSHAEGEETLASDDDAHAEGYQTKASADASHAEGWGSKASNSAAHAEGYHSLASGDSSHSEGNVTWAQGDASHAEGKSNYAIGFASHVEGISNSAYAESSHVQGKYALFDTMMHYAHIVGNGEDNDHRANIHTIDWEGNAWFKGRLSQNGEPRTDNDLVNVKYVNNTAYIPQNIINVNLTTDNAWYVNSPEIISRGSAIYRLNFSTYASIEYYPCEYGNESNDISGIVLNIDWGYPCSDYLIHIFNVKGRKVIYIYRMSESDFMAHYYVVYVGEDNRWKSTIKRLVSYSDVLSKNNTFEYVPIKDYHPATKKYVDVNLSEERESIMATYDGLYEGRDLTNTFASEIANFTDEWAWIKARIQANNYTGIHVGDYIPMSDKNGNNTYNMQVAGIDTYYNTQELKIGHHIDFISKECCGEPVKWNTSANNNGTSARNSPYLASNIYKVLSGWVSSVLPQNVQKQIVEKKTVIERRYSAAGALTASTTQSIQYIGKLWLPSEYEVFGSVVRGTPEWSQGQATQYPIFANSWKNRAKVNVDNGKTVNWWTLTTHYGDTTHICTVGKNASINAANNATIHTPICFRIDDSAIN